MITIGQYAGKENKWLDEDLSHPLNKLKDDCIYEGDCMEFMKMLPDKYVDCVITDPPYNMTNFEWDKQIDFLGLWKELKRIGKNNCNFVFMASQPFATDLINSNRDWFRYELIWKKSNPSNISLVNVMPLKYHENILIFYKEKPIFNKQPTLRESAVMERHQRNKTKLKNYGTQHQTSKPMNIQNDKYNPYMKNPMSVLCIPSLRTISKEYVGHPTQKPLALFKWLIKSYSNEKQLVLDPFAGSGTTLVASKELNRQFLGCEINPDYVKIIRKRLSQTSVGDFNPPTEESLISVKRESADSPNSPQSDNKKLEEANFS